MDQVIIDLPSFVPETYTVRLSIDGRPYVIRYGEARVDEVLEMMLDTASEEKLERQMHRRREIVEKLLCSNVVEGDAEQLRQDLKLVPYRSLRDGLDIFTLYLQIQSRVKKKPIGRQAGKRSWLRGFLAKLPF
jgi:phosphoribosylformylglycinamidine (FGAM) synthase PurS component